MAKGNKASRGKIILVAGGAGFVGSHLCTALLGAGNRVICLDSYLTGSPANLIGLQANPYFAMVEQDVCDEIDIDEPVDQIYNLACPASPPSYQADPIHTMMTSVTGTGNLLRLAERHGATFRRPPQADLRRSRGASAAGELLGPRQLHRAAGLLRRGQTRGRSPVLRQSEGGKRRHAGRSHLQHLRSAYAPQ